MICSFCEAVDPPLWELCPERVARKHRLVSELRQATALGVSGERKRPAKGSRAGFTPASGEQREKRRLGKYCIHCGAPATDPMHVIPRGQLSDGQDDERATVNGCRRCHDLYDSGELSLLEDLEMYGREELAYAVLRFGLIQTLQRVTNTRWEAAA